MKAPSSEYGVLLDQVKHIASGLGATLAPFCEVVVHDLLHPEHAILAIHNNLSGRRKARRSVSRTAAGASSPPSASTSI